MLDKTQLIARIESADLYDWDELVQEDRVHRLIYTDPAIFQAEMTNIFGAVWVYLGAREPDPEERRLHHRAAGPAADHPAARFERQDPRAVQSLHPSRHHALPQGKGLGAHLHLPLSRLELPQHRQAARRCRGRTAMPAISRTRSSTSRRCRAWTAIAASSSATLNPDAPLAARLSRRHHQADRRMARSSVPAARSRSARPTGSSTRATGSSPTTIPATATTSCSRTARCWRWRTGRPTSPTRACPITRARPTRRRCTWPIWATAITSRTSGRTSRSAPADCGRWKARRRARSITTQELRRRFGDQGRGNPRPRLLRAGQHQRVSELLAARQPHPGVRAGLGRRDQRHLVRHRRGRRRRRARRRGRRDQCAAHAHAGAVPEFRRGRRSRQFRGDPARARLPRGRVGLHASRARHSRPREDRRRTASSPRPPPTRRSCANTSRSGSG